jgi:biotin carboxylase
LAAAFGITPIFCAKAITTALVQSKEEALDFARTWKFPVIVKGQDGAFPTEKE